MLNTYASIAKQNQNSRTPNPASRFLSLIPFSSLIEIQPSQIRSTGSQPTMTQKPTAQEQDRPCGFPSRESENKASIQQLPWSSPRVCNHSGPSAALRIFLATC